MRKVTKKKSVYKYKKGQGVRCQVNSVMSISGQARGKKEGMHIVKDRYKGIKASKVCSGQNIIQLNLHSLRLSWS